MEIAHVQSQRVAFTPAHIQLACDGVYLALPLTRTSVGVWSLQHIDSKPLELVGHSKTLRSLVLGNKASPKQLVSAADDYVIVWNIQQARQQSEKGEQIRGRVIGTTISYIQHCAFSPNDSRVAVCTGNDIVILLTQRECREAVLEGHDGLVTAAEFCPHYSGTLVTISEDRTFKVWNIDELTLVYQSPILTASPFISIAMALHEPRVAIGASDGVVRVIDLTDGNGFRILHQLDASKHVTNEREKKYAVQAETRKGPVTVSSRPTWKQAETSVTPRDSGEPGEAQVEPGSTVIGLYYTYVPQEARGMSGVSRELPFLQNKSNIVNDLLTNSPMLLVGTTAGLLQVNAKTLDMCNYIDFQEPIQCKDCLEHSEKTLNAAGTVIFGQGADQQIWCIVGSPFQNVVHILRWHQSTVKQRTSQTQHNKSHDKMEDVEKSMAALESPSRAESSQKFPEITVLSRTALLDDSPLRAEMKPKQKEAEKKPRDFVMPARKGSIPDNQPLTFKTKVKSSGYSASPRMTMFKPKTNVPKSAAKPTPPKSSAKPFRSSREYPMNSNPPQHIFMKEEVAERPTAVNSIAISDEGHNIACALANKSSLVFSLPLSKNGATAYTGHNHIVTDVGWSHSGSRLITSSDDKTAALWVRGQSDPVLVFSQRVKSTAPSSDNKVFSKEVRFSQFYFMDKFVLLCSGKSMFLYKYLIDLNKNDIQRYLSTSKYKLVQEWEMESQQITALSAINSFLSYIVLCACSNKTIEVYDLNVGCQVRKMTDVHSRPVHAICQNEGSQFASHPSGAYDLFASAAAGDCIKLWDLRTNRCVRRYEGHLNRVHPCGLSFSPCGRFIATGSEDKCSYIFDLRSGTFLHKLQGHTDVVSDVAFHPLHPQLYTASLDGRVALYNNR